jgi:hypothetical protein
VAVVHADAVAVRGREICCRGADAATCARDE